MKTFCRQCQNEMELIHETVRHTLIKKEITVNNVPMYACGSCGNSFYPLRKQLEKRLEDAYRENLSSIDFKE